MAISQGLTLSAGHPGKGAERCQPSIPLCFPTVDACGRLPSATGSHFPDKNSPRCVKQSSFLSGVSTQPAVQCTRGRDLGSPIFFQGIYNKQDFFITCKNMVWSLCWLVLTLARGHTCRQPCQHAALAVTAVPMATNSHWEKEARSLKKDPDRTAKIEFFFTIHDFFWSSAWRKWQPVLGRAAARVRRRATTTTCVTGPEQAACLQGTLIWKDEKQTKEILDQVSARHFLEIKGISHFKEVNWHCVLAICKYKLSSKKTEFGKHPWASQTIWKPGRSLGSPDCPWSGLPPQGSTTFPVLNTSDKLRTETKMTS